MIHELKILPQYFNDIVGRKKSFELRKNDRNFKVGDGLLLREFDGTNYTGRTIAREVNYIHYGDGNYGIENGYVVLGLKLPNLNKAESE